MAARENGGARESADEFPDTQSEPEKVRLPRPQSCKACHARRGRFEANGRAPELAARANSMLREGASTGTGRAPGLAARASAHAR